MRFSLSSFRVLCCLGGLGALNFVAPPGRAASPDASKVTWDKTRQGAFVTETLQDGAGRIWVATEDNGVWMRDQSGSWKQFTASNSAIGDDTFYALAQDRQGRIWAGTSRHGVSVFDGKKWRNYDLESGVLGERVLDIAVSPVDGDVWMATNLGTLRYRVKNDDWVPRTRANGLPSDQVQSLAFDSKGTLFAATQCDGLAIADAKDSYAKWRRVLGSPRAPTEPFGNNLKAPQGLPSNLLNDVLVTRDDTVLVATTCGLAKSADGGATWSYARGRDWGDKVLGRWGGPPYARWRAKAGATLSEDYVTCLAQDSDGNLWVGHRRTGYEVFDPKTNVRIYGGEKDAAPSGASHSDYVTSFLTLSTKRVLVGFYGGGAKPSGFVPAQQPPATPKTLAATMTPLMPSPAKPPTFAEIEVELNNIRKLQTPLAVGAGVYEGEDWRTQGDWLGRYGRQYALLCAALAPLDHIIYKDNAYDIQGEIGAHHTRDDGLRHFVALENAGDNLRVLYDPIPGYRREAIWDDHGETYAGEFEGPDVWVHILVPEGVHRISAYFGTAGRPDAVNLVRDYLVELKPDAKTTSKADKLPSLATTRVRNFWGGVHKSFVVRGPSIYWLKVGKNNSYNAILQGLFIDKLVGPHTPFDDQSLAWMGRYRYEAPDPLAPPKTDGGTAQTAISSTRSDAQRALSQKARLWEFWLDGAYGVNSGTLRSQKLRLMVLRALNDPKNNASPELLARWRWKERVWNDDDRKSWRVAMKEGREAMLTLNPHVRGVEF